MFYMKFFFLFFFLFFFILLCLEKNFKKSQKFIHIRFFIFNQLSRVVTVFSNIYGAKYDFLYNILMC
jgi:hypothetical protein